MCVCVMNTQEVVLNDRLGKKLRVKCNEDDTIGDLKKLVAAQTGTVESRNTRVNEHWHKAGTHSRIRTHVSARTREGKCITHVIVLLISPSS